MPDRSINVLVVGRSQSGKSTMIQALKDPSLIQTSVKSGLSLTKNPCYESFTITDDSTKTRHIVNVIDTPGLKEIRRFTEETRSDDELLRELAVYIQKHMDRLNCICYVSEAGRTHQDDINIFEKLMDFFDEVYSEISLIILTHCDEFTDKKLDEFYHALKTNPNSQRAFNYCKLGIVYHGIVNVNQLDAFHEDEIRKQKVKRNILERTLAMRQTLIGRLIACENTSLSVVISFNRLKTLAAPTASSPANRDPFLSNVSSNQQLISRVQNSSHIDRQVPMKTENSTMRREKKRFCSWCCISCCVVIILGTVMLLSRLTDIFWGFSSNIKII